MGMMTAGSHHAREIKSVLSRLSELPTPPAALYKMLDALSNPKLSMARISKTVMEDPALSSKMLKLANSPYYGFQKEVMSVEHAMVLLGVETVKALALGVSIFNTFHNSTELKGVNKAGLWTHFLAVGLCAQLIAKAARMTAPDVAFTAGIIHDIGRLALLRLFPADSAAVVERLQNGELTLIEAEKEAFGLDHQEAGAFLADHWSLPEELHDCIALHHDEAALKKGRITGAIYLADKICKRRQLGWTGEVVTPELTSDELAALGLSSGQLAEVHERLTEKASYMQEFFKSIW